MNQTVKDGIGQGGIANDLMPILDWQLAGDNGTLPVILTPTPIPPLITSPPNILSEPMTLNLECGISDSLRIILKSWKVNNFQPLLVDLKTDLRLKPLAGWASASMGRLETVVPLRSSLISSSSSLFFCSALKRNIRISI